jgi:hypothetical protein
MPALSVAAFQIGRKLDRRRVAPFGPTKTRPRSPGAANRSRCQRSPGASSAGKATVRRPAFDYSCGRSHVQSAPRIGRRSRPSGDSAALLVTWARLTPTRRLFPRLSGRRSLSADLPVRGRYRGTRCEPGCPRRNRSAVYRSVCSAGRVSGVITLSPECQGLAGVLCLSLGSGSLAGGIVGRVHRDDRRPGVETGAPQVAAPT